MSIVDNWENTKSTKKRNMDSAILLSSGQHPQSRVWPSVSMWMQKCALSKLPQAHQSLQAYPLHSISLLAPSIPLDEEKENQRGKCWNHVCASVRAKSLRSCLTLCNSMDCSPPGSSVRGILQARILEWVAISFSKESSRFRESNTALPHCRQIFYCLSHQGSPMYTLAWMVSKHYSKREDLGTSLVVQWLGIHIPSAGGLGLIPAWGAGSHILKLDPTCHS